MISTDYTVIAVSISLAKSSWSQSLSSSIRFDQVQGSLLLPSIQCWNMALQHASGSLGNVLSMSPSFELLLSKSKRSPKSIHIRLGARRLITLIFCPSPDVDLRTFKLQIVNSESAWVCECVCVLGGGGGGCTNYY